MFDALAEQVHNKLPERDAIALALDQARTDGSYFVDVAAWSSADRARLLVTVNEVLKECVARGPDSLASPEFFEGYVEKLRELIGGLADAR